MLNNGKRELCYTVKIDNIEPIVGSDNCEAAIVGGWKIMVRKNTFKPGDIAVYFEIDSKVPETKEFEFLASKHFKIKTQKYTFGGKGNFISQGLLMSFKDFEDDFGGIPAWMAAYNTKINMTGEFESLALTDILGVKYAIEADNKRKASNTKYQGMIQRHPKLFKNKIIKWLFKRKWGKELLFLFLGKKRDSQYAFPSHFEYIHKTDEERIENLIPGILECKDPWIKTLKIDGSSTTFILERKPFGKYEFYVTSRNVRQLREDQATYHESNIYWDMAKKYNIEEVLKDLLLKHPEWKYICLQGETAGVGVQGNPNKLPDTYFFGFNLIDSINGRWNSVDAQQLMKHYNIMWVPILEVNYILPDTIEELKAQADGPCDLPFSSGPREGFVYRSLDGKNSFKNVSNNFLLSKGQ